MQINFSQPTQPQINVGDLMVFTNGKVYLIGYDFCGAEFRAMELTETKSTCCYGTKKGLITDIEAKNGNTEYRVIKAQNIMLGEK